MKKCIVLFAFVILFFAPTLAFAQEEVQSTPSATPEEEFNFERAYKDYIYRMDIYKEDHAAYVLARSQYLQAKTLASKTKARDATAQMLQSRDDVITTYLTALRMRLNESAGIAESDRENLYTRIDAEVAWFSNHRAQISSAGTLEDLVADSNEAKARMKFTEPIMYLVLTQIPIGKTDVLSNDVTDLLSRIKNKTNEIRSNGDHDITLTERWLIETESKVNRGLDKKIEAQTLAFALQEKTGGGGSDVYNNVLSKLTESLVFMKETMNYMREIVRQLKTKA